MVFLLSNTRAILFLLLIFQVVALVLRKNPTRVLTQQGYVKGIREDIQTTDGLTKTIYKFLGVPYAEKPIGELNLRFKPPKALITRRSSDYNATFLRPICMQDEKYFDSIRGTWPGFDPKRDMSEDCLYLNIYTPSTTGTRKYPVIVHIHGGSYVSGAPTRDISPGEYLPTREVVLVGIQYRLGTFGFFTTGDSEAPGNMGLLDQVEALKWVQQNIDGFGGDKNSVTLLGESAGGYSVGLHYLSPLSKKLFHRGIAVSGVDFSPFAVDPKANVLKGSNLFVEKVKCTKNTSRETVNCLQSLQSAIVFNISEFDTMKPFVDQHFLPNDPEILREKGKFHHFPLISGFVSQEGSILANFSPVSNELQLESLLKEFMPMYFGVKAGNGNIVFNALKSQYTPAIKSANDYLKNVVDMWSDFLVMAPTHAVLTLHSHYGAPSYMFEFAHRSRHHPKPQWMGVIHEDTTAYTFGLPLLRSNPSKLVFDEKDRNISDMVVTMFTDFAKFGRPTPTPVHGVQWTAFNASKKSYLKIQSNPVMKKKYHPQRMNFWNCHLPKLLARKRTVPSSDDSESRDVDVKRNTPFSIRF